MTTDAYKRVWEEGFKDGLKHYKDSLYDVLRNHLADSDANTIMNELESGKNTQTLPKPPKCAGFQQKNKQ